MMLLLAFFLVLCLQSVNGQECPDPPPCANLWLEIVRQDPGNVVTSCTGSADVCGDKFRQVFFKVYLRNKKLVSPSDSNGLDDFYLDYSKLDVILALKNLSTLKYSHIDVGATNDCFINGVGAKWYNYSNNDGDKVIFPPGYCYSMSSDSRTFNYCFEVPDNAPTVFSLNPSKTMELVFSNTGKGCITNVTVTKLAVTYVNTENACIPRLDAPEGFSICANSIKGTVRTELGVGIEEVEAYVKEAISTTNCEPTCSDPCGPDFDLTDVNGYYSFCDVCATCDCFMIEPEKNDNPLNGVTTYDLVLINKHILGIEAFNSPYKMIAADANKNGSITTFDIVELRKLILGIYTDLPIANSWRFINRTYSFPDSLNPFIPPFLQVENCIAPQSSAVDFIGIKVGDVNNTATANRPAERPIAGLTWPSLRTAQGGIVTLPITYAGAEPMEAVQMGLRFDPAVLQLIGPSQGDLESYLPGNFNLLRAAQGEIRTLWLPMAGEPEPVLPGTVLFYLSFKVLADMPESGLPLWLDEQLLVCSAWKSDGTEYALLHNQASKLRAEAVAEPKDIQASVRPNLTSGTATLVVQAAQPEKARVMLFDAFGRRLAMREVSLAEGPQEIPLNEAQGLPSGVYVWKIFTPTQKAQGHLVKQ